MQQLDSSSLFFFNSSSIFSIFFRYNEIPDKLDEIVKVDDYEIHVCNSSLMHLLGTKIDWKEDIMGQGFHFENPMAQSKCGCGTSFSSKAFL